MPAWALLPRGHGFVPFCLTVTGSFLLGCMAGDFLFIFLNKSASSRSAPGLPQDNTGSLPSAFGKELTWGRREHTKRYLTGNFLFYKMKVTPCATTRGVKTQAGLTRREINVEVTLQGFSGRQAELCCHQSRRPLI